MKSNRNWVSRSGGLWIGICPETGKLSYLTRSHAKKDMKSVHPGETSLSVYKCGNHFHYGNNKRKGPGWWDYRPGTEEL